MRRPRGTAFAPGGVGNVGPGLDVLGLAVAGAGDTVRAEWTREPGIRVRDAGHPSLSSDPARHTSALAARAVLDAAHETLSRGAGSISGCEKGLPLAGGQGGSAASAVAGAVAVNALLGGRSTGMRCSTPASWPRRSSPAVTSTTSRRR